MVNVVRLSVIVPSVIRLSVILVGVIMLTISVNEWLSLV